MTEKEIENIIVKGEGLTIEFKTAKDELPKNIFETVCAFLNRNGGIVILGIDDDKNIVGVDINKVEKICKEFSNLSNNSEKLEPVFLLQPKVISYKEKKLIHVFVPASSQVHKTAGKIYDRSNDGDYIIKTHSQISQIYLRKNSYFSENTIYPFLNESHFEKGIVQKAKNIIRANRPNHPWLNLSNKNFYKVSGLYVTDIISNNEGFTMAALLLFGKEEIILSAIPHYKIDALVRKVDVNRYDDREVVQCNLISAYEVLMSFISKHLPDKFFLIGDNRV